SEPFGNTSFEHIQETTGCTLKGEGTWDLGAVQIVQEPCELLLSTLNALNKVWPLMSEANRRSYIDAFLLSVLSREEFHYHLRTFTEETFSVSDTTRAGKRSMSGRPDYLIGHGRSPYSPSPPVETHVLVVEGKVAWSETDRKQLAAGAAALHHRRKNEGKKNLCVWESLTNAVLWDFCFINQKGEIEFPRRIFLVTGLGSGTELTWDDVKEVYSHLLHVVRLAYLATPPTTPQTSANDLVADGGSAS
ncbi:hypothetical protein HK104_010385, partial [Borealophlyctis nickersoniae]